MIEIQNLSFSYRIGEDLLSNINFKTTDHEIVAVVGENGSGKTTFLRILAGIESRYSGKFSNTFHKISFVPTALNNFLLPWYSVAENLAFFESKGRKLSLVDRGAYLELFERQMPKFSGPDFFEKETYEMSSGQKAILAVICAISTDPDLLILDETFANLSTIQTESLCGYVRETAAKSTTIIFTSHHPKVVEIFEAREFSIT